MKNQHPWRGRLAVLLFAGLAGGCALLPTPAPQLDEQVLGAPLPYELPLPGVKPAPPLPAVAPEVVRHGPRRKKRIALTFDACATQGPSQFDERVIRTLINLQVPATLFLGGKWMEEHPHLPRESDERVREEFVRTQDMLYTLTGRRATLFRAPYGELDARVAGLGADAGMIAIQYDLASGDPDPRISTKRLIDYVTDQAKNGSIVVMHMNGRGWKTAEALPRIVLRLRKKGYKLVTVSELLGRPPAPPVSAGPVLRD